MKSILFCMAVFFGLLSAASPDTYLVPDDFATIQAALNSSSVTNGDQILVRSGTYMENIRFNAKEVLLKSESGPWVTVIDGNQSGPTVTIDLGEGLGAVLDGFTVTNGSGKAC